MKGTKIKTTIDCKRYATTHTKSGDCYPETCIICSYPTDDGMHQITIAIPDGYEPRVWI